MPFGEGTALIGGIFLVHIAEHWRTWLVLMQAEFGNQVAIGRTIDVLY
ncbi:hypothetical protein VII00023_21197 [Vibrio ichthyoenteri ATCC 700023]|uniref:Uncharacterized protein n=1 Tax=Vibrio ichthyoenteri ATCC 700023 TaxID=870968 RepID=F9RZH7_9VIBR|nr:hypothetical protein VII00023_21197 [Vibrio ichthyoenteri ATCC 700023]